MCTSENPGINKKNNGDDNMTTISKRNGETNENTTCFVGFFPQLLSALKHFSFLFTLKHSGSEICTHKYVL